MATWAYILKNDQVTFRSFFPATPVLGSCFSSLRDSVNDATLITAQHGPREIRMHYILVRIFFARYVLSIVTDFPKVMAHTVNFLDSVALVTPDR